MASKWSLPTSLGPGAVRDPPIEQCPGCNRSFAPERLVIHLRSCIAATAPRDGFRATVCEKDSQPMAAPRWESPLSEDTEPEEEGAERIACQHCGRRFVAARLAKHEAVCALALPGGFRATVRALDATEREKALRQQMQQEREDIAHAAHAREVVLLQQVEAAEHRAEGLEAAMKAAEKRAEVAEAAARSMEAAYDVVTEEAEEKARALDPLHKRLEAAESALDVAVRRAERAEAAASSMEAAHDVAMEEVKDGQAREAALARRLEEAEAARSQHE